MLTNQSIYICSKSDVTVSFNLTNRCLLPPSFFQAIFRRIIQAGQCSLVIPGRQSAKEEAYVGIQKNVVICFLFHKVVYFMYIIQLGVFCHASYSTFLEEDVIEPWAVAIFDSAARRYNHTSDTTKSHS